MPVPVTKTRAKTKTFPPPRPPLDPYAPLRKRLHRRVPQPRAQCWVVVAEVVQATKPRNTCRKERRLGFRTGPFVYRSACQDWRAAGLWITDAPTLVLISDSISTYLSFYAWYVPSQPVIVAQMRTLCCFTQPDLLGRFLRSSCFFIAIFLLLKV